MASDALAITGATATGKTALAIEVAHRLDGEIVSMDSRQVYRGMDIGTAKATPAQRAVVPHHGLDLIDPTERFSAERFARLARGWITDIRARARVPLLAGGTGFFLRALTHPLFAEPPLDPAQRGALHASLEDIETDELRRWLARLDPELAARLGREGGRQRLLRGIEIALLTGHPLSWWHAHAPPAARPVRVLTFVLELPRADLIRRIDARVDRMIEQGLVAEVRRLVDAGVPPDAPGLTATGYREIIPYLQGLTSLEAARDEVRRATRRYARRQVTWCRHQLPGDAVRLDARRPVTELTDEIVARWRER